MLKADSGVNIQDVLGNTSLHKAQGNAAIQIVLLHAGAQLDLINIWGKKPSLTIPLDKAQDRNLLKTINNILFWAADNEAVTDLATNENIRKLLTDKNYREQKLYKLGQQMLKQPLKEM